MKARTIVNICATTIIIFIAVTCLIKQLQHQPALNENSTPTETSNTFSFAACTNITLVRTGTNEKANIIPVTAGPCRGTNWAYEGTLALFREFKADNEIFGVDRDNICLLTSIASHVYLDMPTNAVGLLLLLYSLPVTGDGTGRDVLDIIYNATNELLAPYLLWGYGTFADLAQNETNETTRRAYHSKSTASEFGICNLDSPYASHMLNMYDQQRVAEGRAYGPGGTTFSPDRHPEEGKEWLLFYPQLHVREVMAHRWLESDRPETAGLLRQYIKQLEAIPTMDSYWGQGWSKEEHPYMKGIALKRWRNLVGMYERAYSRWLEDGKREPLHSGPYDDENWREYQQNKKSVK